MYMKGGTFFWNWHHKVTEMLDGEITTGTQHWLVGDDNHNYAAGLDLAITFMSWAAGLFKNAMAPGILITRKVFPGLKNSLFGSSRFFITFRPVDANRIF